MSTAPDRRLLLVHAHPDDESINNGATMARYAAEGAHVTLVTCTLGEEGEVIPPELAHLAPGAEADGVDGADEAGGGGGADPEPGETTPLGRHRMRELSAAMRELGVADHRVLGGPGRYRDSGMMGEATNDRAGCFWRAPVDEAARHLVPVIREVRPQVLVTYGPDGGYGHPDHIQAHRVAMRAAELAAVPGGEGEPHTIERIYWNCVPRAALADGFARLAEASGAPSYPYDGVAEPGDVPGLLEDGERYDVRVDARAYAERKRAAMRAHATQIVVDAGLADGGTFALSNGLGQPLLATEFYRLAEGADGAEGARPTGEAATDLFAGVIA